MANNYHEWCYLSGRINVLECYLLNTTFFERLLSSKDLHSILTNLNNTPLKAYFTDAKHLYEFERLLDDYYYDKLYEIRSLSPDSTVCDFFLIKNDILNLKKFIRSKILAPCKKYFDISSKDIFYSNKTLLTTTVFSDSFGLDARENKFLRGTISRDTWDSEWYGKATSLPKVFKESLSFFKTAINNLKKESLPFIIDLICDSAYLRYIENISNEIHLEIIKLYLKIYQLVHGLKIIRRATILKLDKKLVDQYFLGRFDQTHLFHKLVLSTTWASEKALHEVFAGVYCNTPLRGETSAQILLSNLFPVVSFQYEKLADNYLLDLIRPVKFIPFGPERVFGYLCGFTTEVFNLKLVLGGKIHRIEENLLKERLRKTYV